MVKKTYRKKYKRFIGTKRTIYGGGGKFTLMTFNIEILLEIFKIDGLRTSVASIDDCKDIVIGTIDNKLEQFKKIFDGVDVACIQENVIVKENSRYLPLFKKINNLDIVSLCHSHIFEWDISKKLYGSEGKLSNSIYCNLSTCDIGPYVEKNCCEVPMMGTTPRCFTLSTIKIDSHPIIIASFHASGGRFEDIQALQNDDNSQKKITQIMEIIKQASDIICGDFNTKLYNGETKDTDNYFKILLAEVKKTNKNTSDDIYWQRYMTWMFGIDNVMKSNNYQSAYNNEIGDTTMYGGTVDMIYYNPIKLSIQHGSIQKMTQTMSGERAPYTPLLSDHFPVKVIFNINTNNPTRYNTQKNRKENL
jgi:endonuclease/exonuclease/phosphatase family metal-dependent hydrolase